MTYVTAVIAAFVFVYLLAAMIRPSGFSHPLGNLCTSVSVVI